MVELFRPAPRKRTEARYLTTSGPESHVKYGVTTAPQKRACRPAAPGEAPSGMTAEPALDAPSGILFREFSTARKACGKIAFDISTVAACAAAALLYHGRRAMYQSDITQFLNQLKQQKPNLEAEQRRGRSLLWDKQPIDLDERATQQSSRVQQTSYVYYQNF
jgi:hypothetical protein